MRIIFATGNAGKMREIRDILSDTGAVIYSLKDLGISSRAEETGETFAQNAYIKVKEIFDLICGRVPAHDYPGLTDTFWELAGSADLKDIIIMSDDSGLCIDYFNGGPGVHSARFMGHETSYTVKTAAIIKELEGVPDEKRGAAFVCHICAVSLNGTRYDTEEKMPGIISRSASGSGGFGYDPILYLPDRGCTSAELTEDEKNSISHRGKALRAMKELLLKEGLLKPACAP